MTNNSAEVLNGEQKINHTSGRSCLDQLLGCSVPVAAVFAVVAAVMGRVDLALASGVYSMGMGIRTATKWGCK